MQQIKIDGEIFFKQNSLLQEPIFDAAAENGISYFHSAKL